MWLRADAFQFQTLNFAIGIKCRVNSIRFDSNWLFSSTMSIYIEITVFGMLHVVFGYKYCVLKYFDFRGPLIHVVKTTLLHFRWNLPMRSHFRHRNFEHFLLTWSFLFTFLTLFGHYWFIIRVYFTFVNKMWWKNCFSDKFLFRFIFLEYREVFRLILSYFHVFWQFSSILEHFW